MIDRRRSAWRFSVPLVCLLAGLLLAATHGVSGGTEIPAAMRRDWSTLSVGRRHR